MLGGAGGAAALQAVCGEWALRQFCIWVAALQQLFWPCLFLGTYQPTLGVNAQSELEQAGELPALHQVCVIGRQ